MPVMDRISVAGMAGTAATFGLGTINELVGIIAGLATIAFMSIKIVQEIKRK
jgi:hypothetical protein